jgi:hypothetical protein
MEPFTLDRNFLKRDVIDNFESMIWTERYYGDSEVELVVPATIEMLNKIPLGSFLGIPESDEIMILESMNPEEGKLKFTGIALLPWMNNRFIRVTAAQLDQHWVISGEPAGKVLWDILFNMCCPDSPYLAPGSSAMGITNPQQLAITGLGLKDYDTSGGNVTIAVPYGPVYDALKEIATTYQLGMQITLDSATTSGYVLSFRSYKGLDRTSRQISNPIIRFSPIMDSLTNIKELQSIAALKTLAYVFIPDAAEGIAAAPPGVSALSGTQYTNFDLRALMVEASDISTDTVGGDLTTLVNALNERAKAALTDNAFIRTVDGEIVPTSQFQYGVDYYLGDVIEVEGNTGVTQISRITEYIRSQDEAGEKAYPTVSATE